MDQTQKFAITSTAEDGSLKSGECDYVGLLDSLSDSVERGIGALGANSLNDFTIELTKQEELAEQLRITAIECASDTCRVAACPGAGRLRGSVLVANSRLAALIRRYAEVVSHSQRTTQLLAAHCRQHSPDMFASSLSSQHNRPTWSSEI